MTAESVSEDPLRAWMEVSRLNWDDRTAVHLRNRTGFYPIDRVRAGDDAFGEPEDSELGDVVGKRLIHLHCHFGLDSIRLARRGAIVTGLDFSTAAIAAARALAVELAVPGASFRAMSTTHRLCSIPNTTLPLSPGDRSFGFRTSDSGRRSLPSFWRRVGGCTSPKGILRHCRSMKSKAGWSPCRVGGHRHRRPFFTTRRRRTPAIQRRSPIPEAMNGLIR